MPKFSKHFKLNAPQAALDFVDVDTDKDTPVYVDPYAIEIRDDVWAEEASFLIRTFFKEVLDAITSGDNLRAQNLMSHLSEPEETFLGVSQGKPKGRGVGSKQAAQLISAIKGSKAFQTGLIEDLSEMALYVENIDRDKISDLTTNIIRSKLVEYTQRQCEVFGIPLHDYNGPPMWNPNLKNWESRYVKLPRVEDHFVILVPKYIVRRGLSLNSDEFYKKQITDFLVAEHLNANSGLVQVLKNKKRKVRKGDVRERHPKSKSFIAEIVQKNPGLLDLYKSIARESNMLVNLNEDDASLAQACEDLANELIATKPGQTDATRYQNIALSILTTCLYPMLIQPHKEWEINDGRKRIDFVFTNAADHGFFSHRRNANNTQATMVIVECKNYSNDIANHEIDQLLGRFDHNRGYFGMITCREVDDETTLKKRLSDAAKSKRGYIICLTDEDFLEMLKAKQVGDDRAIDELLHSKFSETMR